MEQQISDVASLGRYETNLKGMHVCMALMVIVSLRHNLNVVPGNTKGESICTVDLLFDWFGLICFANKNKN
jgi:hypothetical protein